MIKLKGITWDHPRGYDSIVAATEVFHQMTHDIKVEWQVRSLKEFGDLPIEGLCDQFDLLMIDHPFVGEAHVNELLIPMEELLTREFLHEQSNKHIGESYSSYTYKNTQYALPIDAAAQFSAFNCNVLSDQSIPMDWDEYLDMMLDPDFRKKVLWPLCPTDLWCSFLTLSSQIAETKNRTVFDENGLQKEVTHQALDFLRQATQGIPEHCWSMNPIEVLEHIDGSAEYAFAPLLFGYSNYGRIDQNTIVFTEALNFEQKSPSAIMGGVGIAVSSKTTHRIQIAEYLKFIMQDEILSGVYFDAGGQPSLTSVWESTNHNKASADFFRNTESTMKNAYIRPTIPGFNDFQEKASQFLHENFHSTPSIYLITRMNEFYSDRCLNLK